MPIDRIERSPASQPLTPPRVYLVRMGLFLVLAGFLAFILYRPIWTAFLANPGLNGLIGGVLLIGVVLAVRQVSRLFREVRWVNALGRGRAQESETAPVLLAPMAALMANRLSRIELSVVTTRSLLDSVAARLDENREIVRYLAGLLVFLGLLGTFWGLIETVSSIGRIIASLRTGGDAAVLFDELKSALAQPLSGMGISFSSSLFGLAGSLVLGFLDLQAGQAQSRFYTELEDWLAGSTLADAGATENARVGVFSNDLALALNRLSAAIHEGGGGRNATQAMASLAEGIQGLVQHMRSEQQMIRDWVEAQAAREKDLKQVLERLGRERIS
jgi:MotA/TolQ/ExbB proton channel family protein